MNNVLDHKGYRFFSLRLILMKRNISVNHDFGEQRYHYAGYFMLFFAMMAIMFTKDAGLMI
jgi:hypothetical protein